MFTLRLTLVLAVCGAANVQAATPACGAVISTGNQTIVFDVDMNCSTTTTTALTINASGVVIDGNGKAIVGSYTNGVVGTGSSITVKNLTANAPQDALSGVGVQLSGTGNRVDNCTVDNHDTGVRMNGAGSVANANRARNGRYGAYFNDSTVGGWQVTNNVFTGNRFVGDQWGTGLYLSNYTGTVVITGNDLTGSQNGIRMDAMSGFVFDNATAGNTFGTNAVAGIRGATTSGVTIKNVNVSYQLRTGYGIYFLSSTGLTIQGVTATGRSAGIYVDGANLTLTGNTSTGNNWGAQVLTGPATVQGNNFTNNSNPADGNTTAALYLANFLDTTVTLGGNDFTGGFVGIVAQSCRNLVLDGDAPLTLPVPKPLDLFTRGNTYEIWVKGGSGITVRDYDFSGIGARAGTAVNMDQGTSGAKILNVKANDRFSGFYVNSAGSEINGCESRRSARGLDLRGSGATVINNIFTDANYAPDQNSSAGVWFYTYTGPVTLRANVLTGNYAGIHMQISGPTTLDNSASLPLTPNVMTGNFMGIRLWNTSNTTVKNWDLSGTDDTGYGVYVANQSSKNVISDVVANDREYGFYVDGPASSVTRCKASNGRSGILISQSATVKDSEAKNNHRTDQAGYGLQVYNFIGNPDVTGNDLSGNDRALQLYNVQDFTFDNLEPGASRLNNLSGSLFSGVRVNYSLTRNVTIKNVDVSGASGTKTGIGVSVEDIATGVTIEKVTALNRSSGLSISARDVTVTGVTASGNEYGMYVAYGPLVVKDSNFSNNVRSDGSGYAIYLAAFRNSTVDVSNTDFRGSQIAYRVNSCGNLVIDGAPANKPANQFGNHASHGLYIDATQAPIVVQNFSFTGTGGGYGVYNDGPGTVENVTASRYSYGVYIVGANSVVTGVTTNSNTNDGIYLGGLGSKVLASTSKLNGRYGIYAVRSGTEIRGNTLRDNVSAAFRLDNNIGPFVFAGNDVTNSGYAVYLVSATDTVLDAAPSGDVPNTSGGHPTGGIQADSSSNVTVRGPWNLDGTGTQTYGVYLTGPNMKVLAGVKASKRQWGIRINGINALVEDATLNQNTTDGLYVSPRGAVVRRTQLRNNIRAGLYLENYAGAVVLEGVDFTGSTNGVYSNSSPDVGIDGAPAGADANIFGGNSGTAVQLTGVNITVKNIDTSGAGAGYGVYIDGANALVDNVIANNRQYGIRVNGAGAIVRNVWARDNQTGLLLYGVGLSVDASKICWNSSWGVDNQGGDLLDADNNFWGTATGPKQTDNPGGTSNSINGRVVYKPFVTEGTGCESKLPVRTLELTGLQDKPANTPQTLRVRAMDVYGAVVSGYTGTVKLVSSDTAATLGAQAKLVNGIGTFSVSLATLGPQSVSAQDTVTPQINGTINVKVTVGAATNLVVISGNTQAGNVAQPLGAPFRVKVTDPAGNGVPDTAVTFATSTTGASVSSTTVFTDANGFAMATGTLSTKSGAHVFTASGTKADNSALVGSPRQFDATAKPGPTVKLDMTGLPSQVVAGTTKQVVVQAQDEYGNPTPDYLGPIVFASGDTQAVLPGRSALTAGAGTFDVTLKTAGSQSVGAADAVFLNLKGGQSTAVVAAAPAKLVLVSGSPQVEVAGTAAADPLVVAATDAFGNGTGGVDITFASVGPGSITPETMQTTSTGRAQAIATLGTTAGGNDFTASATGLAGSPVRFQLIGRAGAPALLVYVSGGGLAGKVGTALRAPLVVLTADANGNRVGNARVTFRTTEPGASVSPTTVTSDSAGQAQAVATLGTVAGLQVFEATATFASTPVRFEETAVEGGASTLKLVSGDSQTGVVAQPLAQRLRVAVEDASGNAVPRVAVQFAAVAAGASVNPTVVVTDANGVAETVATLGRTAGAQTFTVAAPGLDGSPVTFKATAKAGVVTKLAVSGIGSPITAGTEATLRIQGQDEFGNVNATYAGPVVVTSDDVKATLPETPGFTAGIAEGPVTLKSAGLRWVRATDASDSKITGAQERIDVRPGASRGVRLTPPIAALAVGAAARVTVQVVDANDNAIEAVTPLALRVDHDATFSAASLDALVGLGTDEATGETDAKGAGDVTITTLTSGTVRLTVGGDGLTDVTTQVRFVAGAADHLVVKPVGDAAALACKCLDVEARLADAYGNAVASALGNVTLEAGGSATITAADLSGLAADALPASKATGRLKPDGTATLTICGKLAENVDVTAAHASFGGRGGKATLDFKLGAFDAAKSEITVDAARIQARSGKAVVTVQPKDECGNDLGKGRTVTLATTAGTATTPVDVGDGTYTSTFGFTECPEKPDDPATISAKVNDAAITKTVSVTAECRPLSGTKTDVVFSAAAIDRCDDPERAAIGVKVTPRDDAGGAILTEAVVTVAGEGITATAFKLGEGAWETSLTAAACSADPKALTLTVNGEAIARDDLKVTFRCPAVDVAKSGVTLERTEIRADGVDRTSVTVVATTVCGEPAHDRPVSVTAPNGKLEPAAGTLDAAGAFVTALASTTEGPDKVTATVDGIALPAREVLYRAPVRYGGGIASCDCATPGVDGWASLALGFLGMLGLRRRRPV